MTKREIMLLTGFVNMNAPKVAYLDLADQFDDNGSGQGIIIILIVQLID